jgi:hypothetical protein
MLRPRSWLLQAAGAGRLSKRSEPCFFTRHSLNKSTSATRRGGWHALVWAEAVRKRAEIARLHPNQKICSNGRPLLGWQEGFVVNATRKQMWRYYSAIACGSRTSPQVCLTFKHMGKAAVLGTLVSSDGIHFDHHHQDLLRLGAMWSELHFTHNVATLRLGEDWDMAEEYAMLRCLAAHKASGAMI